MGSKPKRREPNDNVKKSKLKVTLRTQDDCNLHCYYAWDDSSKIWRLYTNETRFGDKIEVIENEDRCSFTIKDLELLKEQNPRKEEEAIE